MAKKDVEALKALTPGQTVNGFEVIRITDLPAMSMIAVELTHPKSGARMLHLGADDAENLFSVAFRTPPPDDTGLPHILEHSVLNGSQRYPVKDPFVELLKTSLATFLNAMTYSDRTAYPCSSMNPRDFHNLLRVYCDAVFFPLLTEDTFLQEGHHLEFMPDGTPIIKGVVYNEMRGVYSSPNSILFRHLLQQVYQSNAYGKDSGGDPKYIPELTYQQFFDFHRTYYHPSNAWIFTYGDVPLAETLSILDSEFLGKFDVLDIDTSIKPLERWFQPRESSFAYPVDARESLANKTEIALMWATNDWRDILDSLAMMVIDSYLLDNAASPLRKALIDSKLGEEVGSAGYGDWQRDTCFIVTLKGSEKERAEAVEKLCLDTIARECENGFDKDKVAAALRRFELSTREIRSEYPLQLMDRVFGSWLYESDPVGFVQITERLDELHKAMAADPRLLEKTGKKWLVDNPHRMRLTLVPDPRYIERSDKETAERVKSMVDTMSDAGRQTADEIAKRLAERQSEGNTPEHLATLPRLAKSDVSPEPLPLEFCGDSVADREFITVAMFSAGISYFDIALTLDDLSDEDIDYLPLFCEAMGKSGAAGLNYADMATREASCTGALDFSPGMVAHVDGAEHAFVKLGVWLKALDADMEKALGVLSDRLFKPDFTDTERLRDIILQARMAWRSEIVPHGNVYASLYAAKTLTPAAAMLERLKGCTQARFVDQLAADLDKRLPKLPDRFAAMRERLFAKAGLCAAQIGAEHSIALGRAWLTDTAGQFTGANHPKKPLPPVHPTASRIGLAAPADIAYGATPLIAPALSDADAPALTLLSTQLSYGYLWNELRVKGGAYGAHARYDLARGVFTLSSFRDPNIIRTLDTFAKTGAYIEQEMDLSANAVEQYIIGAIKTLDKPLRPPSAVAVALHRHLTGETDEFRQEFRTRLLSIDGKAVRDAASRLFSKLPQAPSCVLSSREKIEEENKKTNAPLTIEPLWEVREDPNSVLS